MRRRQLRADAVISRSLVDDAIVECMTSVHAMQTDHMHPPPHSDGFDGVRDLTRNLAEDKREATREAKDAEDSRSLAVRENARALASHQAVERERDAAAVDAERTAKTIRDAVGVITERLRGSSAHVKAAHSTVESAIAAVNDHVAANDRLADERRAYAEALATLTYTKASLVVALRDECVVASEAASLMEALERYNLGSVKEELGVALQCIAPTNELIVAQNSVYEACRFVVAVYTDLTDDM